MPASTVYLFRSQFVWGFIGLNSWLKKVIKATKWISRSDLIEGECPGFLSRVAGCLHSSISTNQPVTNHKRKPEGLVRDIIRFSFNEDSDQNLGVIARLTKIPPDVLSLFTMCLAEALQEFRRYKHTRDTEREGPWGERERERLKIGAGSLCIISLLVLWWGDNLPLDTTWIPSSPSSSLQTRITSF